MELLQLIVTSITITISLMFLIRLCPFPHLSLSLPSLPLFTMGQTQGPQKTRGPRANQTSYRLLLRLPLCLFLFLIFLPSSSLVVFSSFPSCTLCLLLDASSLGLRSLTYSKRLRSLTYSKRYLCLLHTVNTVKERYLQTFCIFAKTHARLHSREFTIQMRCSAVRIVR